MDYRMLCLVRGDSAQFFAAAHVNALVGAVRATSDRALFKYLSAFKGDEWTNEDVFQLVWHCEIYLDTIVQRQYVHLRQALAPFESIYPWMIACSIRNELEAQP